MVRLMSTTIVVPALCIFLLSPASAGEGDDTNGTTIPPANEGASLCNNFTEEAFPEIFGGMTGEYFMQILAVTGGQTSGTMETIIREAQNKDKVVGLQSEQKEKGTRFFSYGADNKLIYIVDNQLKCSTNGSGVFPLEFDASNIESYVKGKGLADSLLHLLQSIRDTVPKNNTKLTKAGPKIIGIPLTSWVGCLMNKTAEATLEFRISYADANTFSFASPALMGLVPVELRIRKFANQKQVSVWSYQFTNIQNSLSDEQRNELFTPPRGVVCPIKSDKKLEPLSSKFTATLTASKEDHSDSINVAYDGERKLVAYDFVDGIDNDEDPLIPLTVGTAKALSMTDTKHSPHLRVIVDGRGSHLLALSDGGDVCYTKGKFELSSHLTGILTGKDQLEMKTADQILLFGLNSSDFVYQGQRKNPTGAVVDVFAAEDIDHGYVYEALMSQPGFVRHSKWQQPVAKNASLLELSEFKRGKNPMVKLKSTIAVSGLMEFGDSALPYSLTAAQPCLNLTNSSYLYLTVKESVSKLMELGQERVVSGLRQFIADQTNVSDIRIADFYFRGSDKEAGNTSIFFVMGEQWPESGTKTVDYRPENNITAAVKLLNATLGGAEIPLTNFDGQKQNLSTVAQSLRLIPSKFGPSGPVPPAPQPAPSESGKKFGSGSMAALGICMLLIGGVLGVIVAFYMWKRNRGIAYQVYE